MNKVTVKITGMTCISCENKIEKKLQNTQGVISAKVSYSAGTAIVTYDDHLISLESIEKAIKQLDYKIAGEAVNPKTKTSHILGIGIVILALLMLMNTLGISNVFNVFPEAEESMGYGMLFIIGLLTSLHCVAMCGGINISQCVPQKLAIDGYNSKLSALRPSLLYNLGRVISYTLIGGIVGAIGSFVSFSGTAKGIVQLLAGVFMIIMGLNLLNIFPWLRKLNPRMPKIFARKINEQKKSNSPFYVGLLNGLMPCGPLQAMQIYALSTGNAFNGALSMLIFSLGTVPLMLGLGALSSLLSKKFTGKMMTVSAVLVVILGVVMFGNGMSLSGITFPSFSDNTPKGSIALIADDVQTVTTKLSSGRYEPIVVQKGIPVKWIIQAESRNINGCNNKIIISQYDKEVKLVAGDNLIEFTPDKSGTVSFSCWMGMIRSKITVVDDINSIDVQPSGQTVNYKIPTDNIAVAKIKDGEQFVEIDVGETSFSPAVVVMQKGIKTTWTINALSINNSNSRLTFPLYRAQINMLEGANRITLIPDIHFDFAASDYTFWGYVKVVDDINSIDLEALKSEVAAYIPTIPDVDDGSSGAACH